MNHLGTDALTLGHVAITLVAIATGLAAVVQLTKNQLANALTALFLATTVLSSATGYFFSPPHPPTPAQLVGAVALAILAVTLVALYVRKLSGVWRAVYVVGAVASVYLNVFVLVIQLFQKVPSPFQPAEGSPPGGPVFGVVQLVVLIAFVWAGRRGVQNFKPLQSSTM